MPPQSQTLTAPVGGTGHGSDPAMFESDPPRLVVCLNMTPTDFPDGTAGEDPWVEHSLDANDPRSIEQILVWIDERLHRSLDEAWAGPPGKNDEWSPDEPEEAWARAVSEILFGLRYGGPGQCYFGTDQWDSYMFSRIQRRSFDYFEIHKARKRARSPAIHLDVMAHKRMLTDAKEDLKAAMTQNEDPAVSLACACQHLATYGTLSRGFTLEEHLNGANYAAGQNDRKAIFDKKQFDLGRWYPSNDAHLKVSVATGMAPPPARRGAKEAPALVEPPMSPGGIYCYNPYGDATHAIAYVPAYWTEIGSDGTLVLKPEYHDRVLNDLPERKSRLGTPKQQVNDERRKVSTVEETHATPSMPTSEAEMGRFSVEVRVPVRGQRQGSHIAFVLRVSPDRKRLQLFDTSNGYPASEHRAHTLMDPLGKEGIYDGNFIRQVSKGHVYCGMGVLPPPPEDLVEQAEFLRRARPIGLLRLVITERVPGQEMNDGHVLFVSRMIRMYGDDPGENFWISRCVWSLRNTPGFTNLQPWWIVYIPRDELARMMWEHGSRERKLSSMASIVSSARRLKHEEKVARGKLAKESASPPRPGLLYMSDFRDAIVLTNDDKGGAVYWQRKRSELSFGATDEKFQGYALPRAIADRVAPKGGQGERLVPWNGERFGERYLDPCTEDVEIEIPPLFRDGEEPQASAQADASPLLDEERVAAARAVMIDDADPSGEVVLV